MAEHSLIEWTDATWNPITGCSVISPGCAHCYAMKLAGTRMRNHPSREGLTIDTKAGPVWNGVVRLNEQWLEQPLRWRKPRDIFVCAHADLFHEGVPDAWIDRIFSIMEEADHHVFQVLTKRSARMLKYLRRRQRLANPESIAPLYGIAPSPGLEIFQPLRPHIWLGVSVEDQRRADERIPDLLAAPAAVRFLSCEPLLGPLDLRQMCNGDYFFDPLTGRRWHDDDFGRADYNGQRLKWVIAGGESGRKARPMKPAWIRALRDQCGAAGVPFFFKQWGEWGPCDRGQFTTGHIDEPLSAFGKRAAGRLLDGRTHDATPAVQA